MTRHEKIFSELRQVAARVFGSLKGEAYLYGSRARGDSKRDSDWDILVIVDEDTKGEDLYAKYAFPFAEIGWKFGEEIIPVLFTRSEWDNQKDTLFFHNILSDHIAL